jgi:WD40 repeat protein
VGHFGGVQPGRHRLATASSDNSARVWDAASGRQLLEVRHDKTVEAVAFSPDGTRLATGSLDRSVRIWSVADAASQVASPAVPASAGQQPAEPAGYPEKLAIPYGPPADVAKYAPKHAQAATPSGTEFDARARRELGAHPAEPLCRIDTDDWPVRVFSVSWHPGGRSIAVATAASPSANTRVYDICGEWPREQVAVKAGRFSTRVLDVAFSPDGTRLATGSFDKMARVWDAVSGQCLLEVRHAEPVAAVAFSPDGTRLAAGSHDNTARVWDVASGQQLLEVRHDNKRITTVVAAVAFSPDGTRLGTGSSDRSARLWDAATEQCLLEVRHDEKVTAVAFSPDATRLATGSSDNSVRIWSVAEL